MVDNNCGAGDGRSRVACSNLLPMPAGRDLAKCDRMAPRDGTGVLGSRCGAESRISDTRVDAGAIRGVVRDGVPGGRSPVASACDVCEKQTLMNTECETIDIKIGAKLQETKQCARHTVNESHILLFTRMAEARRRSMPDESP